MASNKELKRREGGRTELSGLSETRNKMDWEYTRRRRRRRQKREGEEITERSRRSEC